MRGGGGRLDDSVGLVMGGPVEVLSKKKFLSSMRTCAGVVCTVLEMKDWQSDRRGVLGSVAMLRMLDHPHVTRHGRGE